MSDVSSFSAVMNAVPILTGGTVGSVTTLLRYLNRAYDTVAAKHVYWTTVGFADSTGFSYPGPGAFGVTTNNYVIVSIYSASQ